MSWAQANLHKFQNAVSFDDEFCLLIDVNFE